MSVHPLHALCIAALGVCVAGCATPRAALDQANNGVALTMSLQAELQKFRSVQVEVARARVESIRRQEVQLATYEAESNFDERILRLAGKSEALALYSTLKDLSDGRAKDALALEARLAELNALFGKMLAPLPDASAKLTAAQEALAPLGEDLSAKERMALASGFAKVIKKTIEENKKKIDDAAAATRAAPVQPAAKSTPPK